MARNVWITAIPQPAIQDIVPGYYMNKIHWSTVYLDGNMPQDVLADIVHASYQLVRSSLSKKMQQGLLEKRDLPVD